MNEMKAELRRTMRKRRNALTPGEAAEAARQVAEVLRREWQPGQARLLAAYTPVRRELDPTLFLEEWLAEGGEVALPRVEKETGQLALHRISDLAHQLTGYRDIPEPDPAKCPLVNPEAVDAILVPGLAFDRTGARLGQGGGHYDRLLARLRPEIPVIGMAYPWQVAEAVPFDSGCDQRVGWIVTPASMYRCHPPA